ncbi:pentapeptide repeat-containing protein [Acidovorax sp. NCPPB 3859]|nr:MULTISPECIES: pentapeptide repeat-containing protein [unclassified Acidovorax]MDA8448613.1 pentapeptide repeat-containing protein [Acidovorax sp. GBBC 3297]MDA8458268.1 pentapeptide repeat-containing protein [Acidovorax sp. GBBC 3333]MDA8463306.1 pentapeptide repeat-containing protein [Acidovorax sp. GBBC 3332]MDA8468089.1 pentapeptide repeat-containing protein [Acidovorax sp. GBBC 3299]WCM79699.1 pentapeptide repeat-containing protein [Acidovorax sp. GBBC 712]
MNRLPHERLTSLVVEPDTTSAVTEEQAALRVGNREVITDHYFHLGIAEEKQRFQNKVFVRLGARRGTVFRKVSFTHSIFDGCYLANCTFDSCDFTGCRFLGSNFHQSAFSGCTFLYATFERTQIDDDILTSEAPAEENLRMRFARTLRMNFAQLGDAKAVNQAISLELEATEQYLRNSWSPKRNSYYQAKYPGWKQIWQFFRWFEFKLLDIIWGNGESILKLVRFIAIVVASIAIYDVVLADKALDLAAYWESVKQAPAIFLGVASKEYSPLALSLIAGSRYVGLALLTALLVKRFGRR